MCDDLVCIDETFERIHNGHGDAVKMQIAMKVRVDRSQRIVNYGVFPQYVVQMLARMKNIRIIQGSISSNFDMESILKPKRFLAPGFSVITSNVNMNNTQNEISVVRDLARLFAVPWREIHASDILKVHKNCGVVVREGPGYVVSKETLYSARKYFLEGIAERSIFIDFMKNEANLLHSASDSAFEILIENHGDGYYRMGLGLHLRLKINSAKMKLNEISGMYMKQLENNNASSFKQIVLNSSYSDLDRNFELKVRKLTSSDSLILGKIKILIKNQTNRTISNLTLVDPLPNFITLIPSSVIWYGENGEKNWHIMGNENFLMLRFEDIEICGGCMVEVEYGYRKRFQRINDFGHDPNRGLDLPPAIILCKGQTDVMIFSNANLIDMPQPDFSMPYNVITLSCTIMMMFYGSIVNIFTLPKKDKAKDPNRFQGGIIKEKLRKLIHKVFKTKKSSNSENESLPAKENESLSAKENE